MVYGRMQPRFHGPDRDLKDLRDLGVRQLLEITQRQNQPQVLGHPADQLPDGRFSFVRIDQVGHRSVGGLELLRGRRAIVVGPGCVERVVLTPPTRPQVIAGLVGGD